jgi:hypothetical protein
VRLTIFEWDDEKAESNRAKHGVSFDRAVNVFNDPDAISIPDPKHSELEERYITIGSVHNDVLVVVHTQREDRIRIISARRANRNERRKIMSDKHDTINDRPLDDYEMLPEYDFSRGERGRFYQGPRTWVLRVNLDHDVAKYFSTPEKVNDALRMLIAEGRAGEPRTE